MSQKNTDDLTFEDIDYRYGLRTSAFHLAGIIPVHGQELDYEIDWHPCLTQVAPNFTAIENAAVECAYAGCETIWIVVNEGATPLIRHRVGEFILDPIGEKRSNPNWSESKYIPIYYIPVDPMDVGRRDSLSWSVLRGIYMSSKLSQNLSSWLIPDRFYVSYPYSIFDYKELLSSRSKISGIDPFYARYDDKTVHDNLKTPFTMVFDEAKDCVVDVHKKETGVRDMSQPKEEWNHFKDIALPTKQLPASEQYTARWFGPKQVFKKATYKEDRRHYLDLSWYYDISSWSGYREYMSSGKEASRPDRKLFKYREWNAIGEQDDV